MDKVLRMLHVVGLEYVQWDDYLAVDLMDQV